MSKLLNVSLSPHIRHSATTRKIMLDVIIATLPALGWGVYKFGLGALWVILLSVASCVGFEFLYTKILGKPTTVGDLSAVVTGLILAMNLYSTAPWWLPVLGGAFAIIVVKMLFGGIGQNFMNPALGARAFLLISFPAIMSKLPVLGNIVEDTADSVASATSSATSATSSATPAVTDAVAAATNAVTEAVASATSSATPAVTDAVASATNAVTDAVASASGVVSDAVSAATDAVSAATDAVAGATPLQGADVSILDMFLGNHAGTIGEVSALAILLGLVYLIVRRVISPTVPLCMVGSAVGFWALFTAVGGEAITLEALAVQVLGGGLLAGAVFMATDYTTSPITKWGRVIFGLLCGFLTAFIRCFSSMPEGVSYAIIIANILAPLIEKATKPRPFGTEKEAKA